MSTLVQDSFTGTGTLQAHTPDVGGAWSIHPSYSSSAMVLNGTEACVNATATTSLYINAATPPSADYTASMVFHPISISAGHSVYHGLCIRCSPTADTMYRVQMNWSAPGGSAIYLYKSVAGSLTLLGSSYAFTPTPGTPFTLSLAAVGTALTVKKDGTTIITATDSAVTAAGKVGIETYAESSSDIGGGAGMTFDDLLVTYTAAGPTSFTLAAPSPATGRPSVASSNFTLTLDSPATSTVTFTPSDASNGGTFSPSSPQITAGNSSVTFTYTAGSTGAKTISATDDAGLTDPSSVTFTAYTLTLAPSSQSVVPGVAASLTATLTGGSGTLAASTTNGTLSTAAPTSGIAFTLTDATPRTDTVTVTGPGGTSTTATVTHTNSPSVSPGTVTIDQLATTTLTASNFTGGTVTWASGNTANATVNASTGVVTGVAHGQATAQTATITATGVSNTGQTATAVVTVRAVAIIIAPTVAAVAVNLTDQFTATVTGSTNTAKTWSVPVGTGSVDSSGLYTAPGSAGTATVRATASADAARHSDAAVTISEGFMTLTSAGIFATGLSTVGYTVYDWSGSSPVVYQARTTTGVSELGSTGNYSASFVASYDVEYLVVWDDGGAPATYASPDRIFRAALADTPGTTTLLSRIPGAIPANGSGFTALGDTRIANLNATVSSRMATYTQPTGFLLATFPTTLASPTNITAGTITTATNLTNAPAVGDLTAAMKASVAAAVPTAAANAAAVWDEAGGSHTSAGSFGLRLDTAISTRLSSASYTTPPTVASVASAVWNEPKSGHATAGTFGYYLDSAVSAVSSGGLTAGQIASAVWDELASGHVISGSFGARIDAAVSSRLDTGSYSAPPSASAVASAVWNEPKSGHATAGTFGLFLDAAVSSRLATSGYTSPLSTSQVAAAVWDVAQASHASAGTFGGYLDSAVSGVSTGGLSSAAIADAVWDEVRSGHGTSGTFGGAIDATISSRSTLAAGAAMTLTSGERDAAADALLDRAAGIETGETPRQLFRKMRAVLLGVSTAAGVFKRKDGTTTSVTATLDGAGARTAVTDGTN